MSSIFTDFVVDGVPYQLSSDCPQQVFPKLCDRVQKYLVINGKELSKEVTETATVEGQMNICNGLYSYWLTIYPRGTTFGS